MSVSFFTPAYIEIVHKVDNRWIRLKNTTIYNLSGKPYDREDRLSKHGLTHMGILKELYRRYQGLDGWYLVHMPEREYYYCGATASDVNDKLIELGIRHG